MKNSEACLPMEFYGWAGQYNEIGPTILINRDCFPDDQEVRIFYADSDYRGRIWEDEDGQELILNENSMWELENLAKSIQNMSSGLTDVKVEVLEPGDGTDSFYAATYRLDKKAVKDIMVVGGKACTPEDTGGYLVVFQRYGEFTAALGVLVNGKPVVLYQDSYCMK
ncbi:MAG: hypothetical protein IJN83_08820 [Clostridia bacterium]|nr:hypothetical protein [Clostridia bacterium]